MSLVSLDVSSHLLVSLHVFMSLRVSSCLFMSPPSLFVLFLSHLRTLVCLDSDCLFFPIGTHHQNKHIQSNIVSINNKLYY